MRSIEGGESGSLTSNIRNLYFPPRSASWMEEMEKRSDRHIRDLVALSAFQGLDANEIGCARISMMAGSKMAPFKGPNTDEPDQLSPDRQIRLATPRPVHTDVPGPDVQVSTAMHAGLLRIVGALTAPTFMALTCRWRSRPQPQ